MKKTLIMGLMTIISMMGFGQKKGNVQDQNSGISTARKIIENAETSRINKDWSLMAEFKSGIGETVNFFPVQIVDLRTGQKENALQVDLAIKVRGNAALLGGLAGAMSGNSAAVAQAIANDGVISAWVGYDEIDEFIAFIEQQVLPNMDLKYKEKSSEFVFNAREITLKYLVHEKRRRLSIILNSAEEYVFWTETRADKIDELLPILKSVKNKELNF